MTNRVIDYIQRALTERKFESLAKRISNDPPDDLSEYAALIAEAENLVKELLGDRQQAEFDSEAMRAARAKALEGYTASDADLDNLPPLPPPKPTSFPYKDELNQHPRRSDLAHLLKSGDRIYQLADNGALWKVIAADDPTEPDPSVWRLDQTMP